MGRPRKHLPENGREIIMKAASNGVGEAMLASALGLTFTTWKRMRRENEEVRELWEEAKAVEEHELVGIIMQAARGAPAEYDADRNVIRAERPPYIPAAMFLAKARHGYRDNGPADSGADTGPRITINLPGSMSREEWAKAVTIEHKDS